MLWSSQYIISDMILLFMLLNLIIWLRYHLMVPPLKVSIFPLLLKNILREDTLRPHNCPVSLQNLNFIPTHMHNFEQIT